MKAASPALIALLNSGNSFLVCDLYTLTLADGTMLRMTSADVPIQFGGNTFALTPLMTRGKSKSVIGIAVDTLDVSILPSASDVLGGVTWPQAVRQGALDGAWVRVERAYLLSWTFIVGTLVVFYGRVADIDIGRTEIKVQVKSALELLNIQMPRNIYQSVCLHTLYDSGCSVLKSSYTVSGAVSSASTASGFTTTLTQATGYFDLGVLTFTSGVNYGLKRTVKSFVAGAFTFALPLPFAANWGDSFTVFAGCDKRQATCSAKFGNLSHFRGFAEIPVPETVY